MLEILLPALRQYRHNDGNGLLAGYDKKETDHIVGVILAENRRLKEREKICPTIEEAEARAMLRALQEIAETVGLTGSNSPRETVEMVKKLAA